MFSTSRERGLATLITQGPMHRADLARALAVSRTTVTNLTQELMTEGILHSEPGSPLKTKIRVSPHVGVLVSVVFRLRTTIVAVGSLDGHDISLRTAEQQPADLGGQRLATASRLVDELLADADSPPVLAAHVAVNTQIDVHTGEVVGGEASRMWSGVNPLTTMAEHLGAPVLVENTARLLALAHHLAETGGTSRNLLYVHLSHGIAMGQIVRGSIVQGSHGGAGELGHMSIDPDGLPCECANRGCLMQYVDEKSVLSRAQMILGRDASIEDLLKGAEAGSRPCINLITDVGSTLGQALVSVCHLLDPDVIVLGGSLTQAGELLTSPVRQVLTQRALPLNTRGLTVTASPSPLPVRSVVEAGLYVLRSEQHIVARLISTVGASAAASSRQ
ncbi:MAG: ROK family protein [Propionibacteriaceae bacterium]|nr:ROK family protein [Propionibacteriaceae bacterium]